MLATVSAKPNSTKPMPSVAFRNGNSGGRTRLWKCWTKCAAETTEIARASPPRPPPLASRESPPAPGMAAASVVISVLPPGPHRSKHRHWRRPDKRSFDKAGLCARSRSRTLRGALKTQLRGDLVVRERNRELADSPVEGSGFQLL